MKADTILDCEKLHGCTEVAIWISSSKIYPLLWNLREMDPRLSPPYPA